MIEHAPSHILIVDDDPLIARLIKRQLTNDGYSVTIATESEAALSLLENDSGQFSLVITDLTMPRMSGKELAQKIYTKCPNLPIIVFTGMVDEEVEEDLYKVGVKTVVYKPVEKNELLEAVAKEIFTLK